MPLPQTIENQKLAEEAVANLANVMRSTDSDFARINASVSIMNRIWGMPTQAVQTSGTLEIGKKAEEPDETDEIILQRLAAVQPADAEG